MVAGMPASRSGSCHEPVPRCSSLRAMGSLARATHYEPAAESSRIALSILVQPERGFGVYWRPAGAAGLGGDGGRNAGFSQRVLSWEHPGVLVGGGRPEMRFSRAMMTRMGSDVEGGDSRSAKSAWLSRSRSPVSRGPGLRANDRSATRCELGSRTSRIALSILVQPERGFGVYWRPAGAAGLGGDGGRNAGFS